MVVINLMIGKILQIVLKQVSRLKLPKIDGKINIRGIKEPIDIIRDIWGVPHIFARNDYDLFFTQGFVQAQDRFWQMEINRRTARGGLSEIFGKIALDTDRTARIFGFNRLGRNDYSQASSEVKTIFKAFADGVNAFLNNPNSKLPVEFTLLRYKPNVWKPEDSATIGRLMLWQLSHAWYGEVIKAKIIEAVGEEQASELDIIYPSENPCTLPKGIEFNIFENGVLKPFSGPYLSRGQGSNSWVISKNRALDENIYLCNDMHLVLMMPGIWYETHLESPETHTAGVTLAGVPMILVGHNNNIAWGSTLAFTDAEDLFIEKLNENSTQYEYKGKWEDLEIIQEQIIVKGEKNPHNEAVLITSHGPIISDVIGYTQQRVAVNSMALRPSKAFKGYYLLNKAQNWDDFVKAMQCIDATQLNMTFADSQGNIGYWVTGRVPIRSKGNGTIPVLGWTGEYEWVDEVPFNEMPHAFNPQEGYIISCNHQIIPDDFHYFLGAVWMNGYRAKRFKELIEEKTKLSPEDCQKIQMDVKCLPALELISHLKEIEAEFQSHPDITMALRLLLEWDGFMSTESVAATIYEILRYFLIRDILMRSLDHDLVDSFMGKGFHPILYHSNEFFGHDIVILLRLLTNPSSKWITNAGGTKDLLSRNLIKTIDWLKTNVSKSPDKWQWGKLHRVTFSHAMALQKPLDQVFNRGDVSLGGNTDTLCQAASHSDGQFRVNAWAPSHRQIINLNDFSKSLMIAPPGQSGHLGSPHYDDMIKPWCSGIYHPMLWTRSEIENQSEGILHLKPSQ